MAAEPPPFQEASRCDVCKCSFSTFRRRHHCRCCGRTLCAEHSSNQLTLPQFGIDSNVRVCADCFNDSSRIHTSIPSSVSNIAQSLLRLKKDCVSGGRNEVNVVTDSISRLDIGNASDTKPEVSAKKSSFPSISECKCGMPLCICEAPAPSKDTMSSQPFSTPLNPPVHSVPKAKKTEPTPKNRGSTSSSRQSNMFNPGQVANSSVDVSSIDYEVTGEGLREAIKNGDTAAAKKLLSQGVNANYRDKQGSSLLHLAAVFSQTDIAFALMDHGASMDCKNSQGETPLDCAPATLQYKMKQKMQDDEMMRG